MVRPQPLPQAWVSRHGARCHRGPRSDRLRQWRNMQPKLRYYGMHVIGFWPLWIIAIAIIAGIWVAGYQDGLQ